jgi:hypothetical protein
MCDYSLQRDRRQVDDDEKHDQPADQSRAAPFRFRESARLPAEPPICYTLVTKRRIEMSQNLF